MSHVTHDYIILLNNVWRDSFSFLYTHVWRDSLLYHTPQAAMPSKRILLCDVTHVIIHIIIMCDMTHYIFCMYMNLCHASFTIIDVSQFMSFTCVTNNLRHSYVWRDSLLYHTPQAVIPSKLILLCDGTHVMIHIIIMCMAPYIFYM